MAPNITCHAGDRMCTPQDCIGSFVPPTCGANCSNLTYVIKQSKGDFGKPCPHEAGCQQRCLPTNGSCTAPLPVPAITTPEIVVGSVLLVSLAAVGIICAVKKAQKQSHTAASNAISTNGDLSESLLKNPLISCDDETEAILPVVSPKIKITLSHCQLCHANNLGIFRGHFAYRCEKCRLLTCARCFERHTQPDQVIAGNRDQETRIQLRVADKQTGTQTISLDLLSCFAEENTFGMEEVVTAIQATWDAIADPLAEIYTSEIAYAAVLRRLCMLQVKYQQLNRGDKNCGELFPNCRLLLKIHCEFLGRFRSYVTQKEATASQKLAQLLADLEGNQLFGGQLACYLSVCSDYQKLVAPLLLLVMVFRRGHRHFPYTRTLQPKR